jgi:Tol biopolymer transport system component
MNLREGSETDLAWLDWTLLRDMSPDGKTVVFDETGVGGGEFHSVYIRDADGSPAIRLGEGSNPRLSPDGRWVITQLQGTPTRLLLLPTGAGETRIVPTGKLDCHNAGWFADGKRICVVGHEGSGGLRLYELELNSGAARAISEEGLSSTDLLVSPDGSYVGARGPDLSFYLYPTAGGAPRPVRGLDADVRAIGLSADGKALFAFQRGVLPAMLYRIDIATGERVPYREISPSDRTGVDGLTRVMITPDESVLAYSYPQLLSDLYVIDGLT